MATHRIRILGFPTQPESDVSFERYDAHATNDQWKRRVGVFADTGTRIGLHGGFPVPKNYVGSPKIIVVWTTPATSGDVEWDFDYRAVGGDDVESLDQTGTQESVNVADTAPSAAHERMEAELSLTAGNLAVDDEVEFALYRDGADAGDTLAASALLFELLFEYADA